MVASLIAARQSNGACGDARPAGIVLADQQIEAALLNASEKSRNTRQFSISIFLSTDDLFEDATAESFVDSVKTRAIADRVCRSRAQLELAIVEYIGWFNMARLHSAIDYLTPDQFEAQHSPARAHALLAQAAPTGEDSPGLWPASPTISFPINR